MEKTSFPPPAFLRCTICSSLYNEPKTLPCLHSFCKSCIINHKDLRKAIECPRCFASFAMNSRELKSDVYLKYRVEFYKTQCDDLTNPLCIFCKLHTKKKKSAVSQCVSCLDLLCKDCSWKHTSTTTTVGHQVISLTKIKTGEYDDTMLPVKYKALCSEHKGEELRLFCKSCHLLICQICFTKDHKEHDVNILSEIIESKEKKARKFCQILKDKVSALCKEKDYMKSIQRKLKKLEEEKENEIKKITSEAVNKIDKEKNKMIQELHDHLQPDSKSLERGIVKVSTKCNTISDTLEFAEHVLKGMNVQKVFLFDELQERLEYLANFCQHSTPSITHLKEMPSIEITVCDDELKYKMTFNHTGISQPHIYTSFSGKSSKPLTYENSSDFLSVSDKAVQTVDMDFENFPVNKDYKKRTYCIEKIKSIPLRTDEDKQQPYFTSVAWINEIEFVAVDAPNAKLKIYSFLSGTILKSKKITEPLAVSVWKDGILCLTKGSDILLFNHALCLQKSIPKASCLCPSLPTLTHCRWIENTTILTQTNKNSSERLSLKCFPTNPSPAFFRYACSLPDGSYVLSDKTNECVYLVDGNGSIFKTLSCSPGSISFDKFYNIFIADFHNSSISVFDLKGKYLANLSLKQRPRSISILHDKLIVAFDFQSKVFVYDIT